MNLPLIAIDPKKYLVINIMKCQHIASRAIVFLCKQGKIQQIYNVVDDAKSSQGDVAKIVAEIFEVKLDFYGNTLSHITKVSTAGLYK